MFDLGLTLVSADVSKLFLFRSGFFTAVFLACGKMPERSEMLAICSCRDMQSETFLKSCWKYIKESAGRMQHYVLRVFVSDRIILCHGIRVGFRWTHGQHTSCTSYGGTNRLSYFLNFGSEKGYKSITSPGR